MSLSKMVDWVEDTSGATPISLKRKRNVGTRKLEFVGWGSKPLLDLLESMGKDTSIKYSQRDVESMITQYVNSNGLTDRTKKKKINCDDKLQAIFGKKSIFRIKIYDLLGDHFAENHDDSSDDDTSEEENDLGSKSRHTSQKNKVPEIPKSIFAAIIRENIKLVYLKKTLVLDLLKVPQNFEAKLLGSFVRVKSSSTDIFKKHSFQLQQITG